MVKDMVRTELRKALSNQGITEEKVLEMYVRAYDTAAELGKPGEMRAVTTELAKLLGMEPGNRGEWNEEEEEPDCSPTRCSMV